MAATYVDASTVSVVAPPRARGGGSRARRREQRRRHLHVPPRGARGRRRDVPGLRVRGARAVGAVADRQRHALRRRRDAGRGAGAGGRSPTGSRKGVTSTPATDCSARHGRVARARALALLARRLSRRRGQDDRRGHGPDHVRVRGRERRVRRVCAFGPDARSPRRRRRRGEVEVAQVGQGHVPRGTFSELNVFSTAEVELEYGVRVSFASATGKTATDVWRFDAVTANHGAEEFAAPQRVMGEQRPGPDPTARKTWTQPPRARSRRSRCRTAASPVLGGDVHGRRRRPDGDGRPGAARDDRRSTSTRTSSCTAGVLRRARRRTRRPEMTSASAFKWRKYRVGDAACKTTATAPWCAWTGSGTVSVHHRVHLAHGATRALRDARGQSRRRPRRFERAHARGRRACRLWRWRRRRRPPPTTTR